MMMISAVTKKRIGILVLEWLNRSRVMVLVFVNLNLYKKNFVQVFLSKSERFWPWQKANILCSCLFVFGNYLTNIRRHTLIITSEDCAKKKKLKYLTNSYHGKKNLINLICPRFFNVVLELRLLKSKGGQKRDIHGSRSTLKDQTLDQRSSLQQQEILSP